jgi:hypothetical protein
MERCGDAGAARVPQALAPAASPSTLPGVLVFTGGMMYYLVSPLCVVVTLCSA